MTRTNFTLVMRYYRVVSAIKYLWHSEQIDDATRSQMMVSAARGLEIARAIDHHSTGKASA